MHVQKWITLLQQWKTGSGGLITALFRLLDREMKIKKDFLLGIAPLPFWSRTDLLSLSLALGRDVRCGLHIVYPDTPPQQQQQQQQQQAKDQRRFGPKVNKRNNNVARRQKHMHV